MKDPEIVFDLDCLDKATFTFKDKTATGLDRVSPGYLKSLPRQARVELAGIGQTILDVLAWPWQALLTEVGLLGKPAGGGPLPSSQCLQGW